MLIYLLSDLAKRTGSKTEKETKKEEKEEEDDWITENGSRTVYVYKEITASPVFTGILQQTDRVWGIKWSQ